VDNGVVNGVEKKQSISNRKAGGGKRLVAGFKPTYLGKKKKRPRDSLKGKGGKMGKKSPLVGIR